MKKLILFASVAAFMASCTNDDLNNAPVIDGEMNNGVVASELVSDPALLNSRVALMGNLPTGLVTRAAGIHHVDEPSIPAGAKELNVSEWGGLDYYQGNEYWNNGGTLVEGVSDYYVPAGKTLDVHYASTRETDNLTIYVAGKLIVRDFRNNPKLTFNVLKGGELVYLSTVTGQDNLVKVVDKINVWGKLDAAEGKHGFSIIAGGEVNYYAGCAPIEIGDQQMTAEYAVLNIAQGGKLYAEENVKVNGSAWFQDGQGTFMNGIDVDGNLTTKEGVKGGLYNIYECSYIRGQWVGESNSAGTFNIYDYLYCGSLHDNGADVTCNLYNSLIDVDNVFDNTITGYAMQLPADYKINRLSDKNGAGFQFIGNGDGYSSVVRYLNDDLYLDDGNNCVVEQGTGVHKAMNVEHSFQGNINLITKTIRCQYTHIAGEDLLYQQGVQEGIVNFVNATATLNNPDCYLPGKGECRPTVGARPDNPTPVVVSPSHKYSATGIAFDDAHGLVYLTWHSNIGNDRDQSSWHGTNWSYGNGSYSPNVEGIDDWGGIVDVIDVANYNPTTAEGLYRQSLIQNEHKYNHALVHNGLLYLPSESNKVEAALHVIALNSDGTLPGEDGKLATGKNTRVNLTGGSANCVEIVDDKVATISGWSKGAVNYFAVGDYSNQSHKPVFGASDADFTKVNGEYVMSANNFAGKYIVAANGKVVTLNNTDKGIISVFNSVNDNAWTAANQFETGKITPRDGKDGIAVDGNLVYVCHSNEGLTVNDLTTGERVGGTFRGANCVDVDDKYIYVAAGDGLVVLSKTEKYQHPDHNNAICNKVLKKVSFTGAGFTMPNGTLYVTDTQTVKQSANFVKVHTIGGKKYVFVAYGLFGLRFYSLDELGL